MKATPRRRRWWRRSRRSGDGVCGSGEQTPREERREGDGGDRLQRMRGIHRSGVSICRGGHASRCETEPFWRGGEVVTRLKEAEWSVSTKNLSLSRSHEWPLLAKAFESEYVGHAHLDLYEYLSACWTELQADNFTNRFPCFGIVQSSGFGKTRLLKELALHFHNDEGVNKTGRHRLVYVNIQSEKRYQDYPPTTHELARHFFPSMEPSDSVLERELAQKLVHVFEFVMLDDQAAFIQELLMELFTGKDWRFVDTLEDKKTFAAIQASRGTSSRNGHRLMVFAIGKASVLLRKPDDKGVGMLTILTRALKTANMRIRESCKYSSDSGIFGVLVDSDAQIIAEAPSLTPLPAINPSTRRPYNIVKLFPPFVLTETMDTLRGSTTREDDTVTDTSVKKKPILTRYRDDVTEALRGLPHNRSSWLSLRKLGRPIWLQRHHVSKHLRRPLVVYAAQTLLCGEQPNSDASYNEHTLNGVAALLCRLGIRPNSSTPLATRLVADFMAVLSYVSHTCDRFVASYSSDPILTLGETCAWHSLDSLMLAERMLPQLGTLLSQEVLARIVLLLAMDACAQLEGDPEATHWSGAGEFFSVWTLLTALHGSSPGVRVVDPNDESNSTLKEANATATMKTLEAVESQWKDWFVSFTHFVQLSEAPSEACLWAMLGRRAAGIMPRGESAVDLVIPICTSGKKGGDDTVGDKDVGVSMIMVQMKDRARPDARYPHCATRGDDASATDETREEPTEDERAKFLARWPEGMLQIYMELRGDTVERFYVEDKGEDQTSHLLCLRGLGPLSLQVFPSSTTASELPKTTDSPSYHVDVLTPGVMDQLQKLLPSWWKTRTLVWHDVDCRDTKTRQRDSAAVELALPKQKRLVAALKTSAEALLLNSSHSEMLRVDEAELGRTTASESLSRGKRPHSASTKEVGSVHKRQKKRSPL